MTLSKAELILATVADRTGPWRTRGVIVSLTATTSCRASAGPVLADPRVAM
jgi:hypothetical protein